MNISCQTLIDCDFAHAGGVGVVYEYCATEMKGLFLPAAHPHQRRDTGTVDSRRELLGDR